MDEKPLVSYFSLKTNFFFLVFPHHFCSEIPHVFWGVYSIPIVGVLLEVYFVVRNTIKVYYDVSAVPISKL